MRKVQLSVLVFYSNTFVRELLELLILDAGWQSETFDSVQEFLCRELVLVPSCLVLDIALARLNDLDMQKHLAADQQDMPRIFVTGHGDVAMAVQAMKAGRWEGGKGLEINEAFLGIVALTHAKWLTAASRFEPISRMTHRTRFLM